MCWFTYELRKTISNNFDSSVVGTSFVHHAGDLALKSPVITAKHGLLLLISLKRWSKLVTMILAKNNASLKF